MTNITVIPFHASGKCFGPLHFSRTDLVSTSIMRGRDHGLPDYNSARKSFGLREIKRWEDINPQLYKENPEVCSSVSFI